MRTVEAVINELDPTLGTAVSDGHVTPSATDIISALTAEGYQIVKQPLAPLQERDRIRTAMYGYLEPYIGRTITANNIDNLVNYLVTSLATDRFFIVSVEELRTRNTIEIPLPIARRVLAIYVLLQSFRDALDLSLDVQIDQMRDTIENARDR